MHSQASLGSLYTEKFETATLEEVEAFLDESSFLKDGWTLPRFRLCYLSSPSLGLLLLLTKKSFLRRFVNASAHGREVHGWKVEHCWGNRALWLSK